MKTILKVIFSISILTSGQSFSQIWPKYYSQPNSHDFSNDIVEAYDKGYIICGNYYTYNGSDYIQNSWLIKTDVNGNVLWDKIIIGGDNVVMTNAVEPTTDGGMLTCGSIWSASGNYDPYVMKINACGDKEWCKIFAGSTNVSTWAQDILENDSGEIIVLINQYTGNNAVHLFLLCNDGAFLWKKPYCTGSIYPDSDHPIGTKMIITSSNKYLISGYVYWENPWGPNGTVYIRPLFLVVNSDGNENLVLPFGLQDTIYGTADCSLELNDNTFLGIGSYWTNQENVEPLFMQYNENGDEMAFEILSAEELDSTLIGGSFQNSILLDTSLYSGGVFKFAENQGYPIVEDKLKLSLEVFDLTSMFTKIYLNFSDPYVLNKTIDDKLLSNSTFKEPGNWDITLSKLNLNLEFDTIDPGNYTYDSLCQSGPPQSGFIFLDDCDIITGTDIPSPEEYYSFIATIPVTAYPNPAETEITLAFQNTDHHNNMLLECYNIYGQQVHTEKIWKGQQEKRIDLRRWAKGLYFAVVKSEGKVAGTGRFVRK